MAFELQIPRKGEEDAATRTFLRNVRDRIVATPDGVTDPPDPRALILALGWHVARTDPWLGDLVPPSVVRIEMPKAETQLLEQESAPMTMALPEPPVLAPEPPVLAPEPPVVAPEPPVVTPEPPVVAPEPPPPLTFEGAMAALGLSAYADDFTAVQMFREGAFTAAELLYYLGLSLQDLVEVRWKDNSVAAVTAPVTPPAPVVSLNTPSVTPEAEVSVAPSSETGVEVLPVPRVKKTRKRKHQYYLSEIAAESLKYSTFCAFEVGDLFVIEASPKDDNWKSAYTNLIRKVLEDLPPDAITFPPEWFLSDPEADTAVPVAGRILSVFHPTNWLVKRMLICAELLGVPCTLRYLKRDDTPAELIYGVS